MKKLSLILTAFAIAGSMELLAANNTKIITANRESKVYSKLNDTIPTNPAPNPTPIPKPVPNPNPSPTPTPNPNPSPTPTPNPTPTPTPSPVPTPTPTPAPPLQ